MTTNLKANLENIDKSKPSTRGTLTDETMHTAHGDETIVADYIAQRKIEDRIGKVVVDAMMFEIGKLHLGPDDLLVMAPPQNFTAMQAMHMAEAFRAQLDGYGLKNQVLVYAGGTRIGILSPRKAWWQRLLGL